MALIRAIRVPPIRPTREKLWRLMNTYGLQRRTVARLMRAHPRAVDYYLYPDQHPLQRPIPMGAWELLLMKVQSIYQPDEPIDLPL